MSMHAHPQADYKTEINVMVIYLNDYIEKCV